MSAWIPLLSGLVGVIIGSITSVITIVVQSRAQARRERLQAAINIAMQDRKTQEENLKSGGALMPISLYLAQQVAVIKAVEEGTFTADRFRELQRQSIELSMIAFECDDEWRAKRAEKGRV